LAGRKAGHCFTRLPPLILKQPGEALADMARRSRKQPDPPEVVRQWLIPLEAIIETAKGLLNALRRRDHGNVVDFLCRLEKLLHPTPIPFDAEYSYRCGHLAGHEVLHRVPWLPYFTALEDLMCAHDGILDHYQIGPWIAMHRSCPPSMNQKDVPDNLFSQLQRAVQMFDVLICNNIDVLERIPSPVTRAILMLIEARRSGAKLTEIEAAKAVGLPRTTLQSVPTWKVAWQSYRGKLKKGAKRQGRPGKQVKL
jgi:hypothetical protein